MTQSHWLWNQFKLDIATKGKFMKKSKSICALMIASLVLCLFGSAHAADNAAARDQFKQRAHAVNNMAEKKGQMKIALQRISTETGVPLSHVQSLQKRYPRAGAADLLAACTLAAETKKDAGAFLKQQSSGKSWAAIAESNNVPLEKLNERLSHLEAAMGSAPEKAK
jgi:hypothetical protein